MIGSLYKMQSEFDQFIFMKKRSWHKLLIFFQLQQLVENLCDINIHLAVLIYLTAPWSYCTAVLVYCTIATI